MRDTRTKTEKNFIELTESKPQLELIQDLYLELNQCYEWMESRAKHSIVTNFFRSKKDQHNHFFHLLSDHKIHTILNKEKPKNDKNKV